MTAVCWVRPTTTRIALLLGAALFTAAGDLVAQTAVPVHREPRHRLMLDRHPIRVLDIQIEPGDTTLFHTHDAAILYVTVGTSTTNSQALGGRWGQVEPSAGPTRLPGSITLNVDYPQNPQTHRVTNVGNALFRLIGIANYGPGDESTVLHDEPAPGAVEVENSWFRAYRLNLRPGESSPLHPSARPVVGVLPSDGSVEVFAPDVGVQTLAAPGEWFFLEAGNQHQIRNLGTSPLDFVVVELR